MESNCCFTILYDWVCLLERTVCAIFIVDDEDRTLILFWEFRKFQSR